MRCEVRSLTSILPSQYLKLELVSWAKQKDKELLKTYLADVCFFRY
jgi:hypothetical protein